MKYEFKTEAQKIEEKTERITGLTRYQDTLQDYDDFMEIIGFKLRKDDRGALYYMDVNGQKLELSQSGRFYNVMWRHAIKNREDILIRLESMLESKTPLNRTILKEFLKDERTYIETQLEKMK